MQSCMTWCYKNRGPQYHWLVDLYSRTSTAFQTTSQGDICMRSVLSRLVWQGGANSRATLTGVQSNSSFNVTAGRRVFDSRQQPKSTAPLPIWPLMLEAYESYWQIKIFRPYHWLRIPAPQEKVELVEQCISCEKATHLFHWYFHVPLFTRNFRWIFTGFRPCESPCFQRLVWKRWCEKHCG